MVAGPVLLTLKLAGLTTLLMLILGTPLAWWLARSAAVWKEESKLPLLAFRRCASELSMLPAPQAVNRMP